MKNLTLENIAKACNGKLFLENGDDAEKEASSIIIDSRKCEKDCVFIATKGERVDGHSFIGQVLDNGALAVICEDVPANINGNYIHVADSFQAIKDIAEFYRKQLPVKIVGIAGSVGKTSTKEMVAAVLSKKFCVQKTAGNFNNEVGVPLTIFSIDESHEVAVVEMGISDFGEMSRLTKIVKPDICVMTNIGPCHLENLKDLDGVLKAKSEIFESMNKAGYVVLNGDDEKLKTIKKVNDKTPRYFGKSEANDIYAKEIETKGLLGTTCKICTTDGDFSVVIPIPGEHQVMNALAGAAVGLLLDMTPSEIAAGIQSVKPTTGRSNIIETEKYIVIDDCYNANPKSMKAAVDLLSMADGIKVAILGDMFELGDNENELHADVGRYLTNNPVDVLICIGALSANIYDNVQTENCHKVYAESLDEVLDGIDDLISRECIDSKGIKPAILVKASHGMHFEKVVEKFKNL